MGRKKMAPVVLPIEFIVKGKPVSIQAKSEARKQAWKELVSNAARLKVAGYNPTGEKVSLKIIHFYDSPEGMADSDNIYKPIRDALNKLVYIDDRQVTDHTCRQRDLNGSFRVKGAPIPIVEALLEGEEFVYIMVESAPDTSEI